MASPQREQLAGTAALSSGTPTVTLFTVPANLNLYIDYISLVALAAIAAGEVVSLNVDGVAIMHLTPVGGSITEAMYKPIIAGATITLSLNPSTTAVTVEWGIAGDLC